MVKDFLDEVDATLEALGVEVESKPVAPKTPLEERVIAGFEDIQRFADEHGRAPQHGESRDIFERIYAVRLDRLRALDEFMPLLKPLDDSGLLENTGSQVLADEQDLDDDALLELLGVVHETSDITTLRHVRSANQIKAAEEIATRQSCEDFETFKPLFDRVQSDLSNGLRETKKFRKEAGFSKTDFQEGHFIIIGGQKALLARRGDPIKAPNGEDDARLRVIYDNGTESDILLRSLIRAMYKDEKSRLITDPIAGPLFADTATEEDLASGTIYALRSKSDLPIVREHGNVLHKIGVTGGSVERRIANARYDATFLLAEVDVVASYKLYNISRARFENLIHRVFDSARLEIEIKDRFGKLVVPKEWFLVPLDVIDEAVRKIIDGSIGGFFYNPETASLQKR